MPCALCERCSHARTRPVACREHSAGTNFVAVEIGGDADSVHGGEAFRVQHAASAPPRHAAPLPLSRAADELKAVPKGAATPLDGLSDISAPAAADSNGPSPVISRRPSATAAAAGPPADDDTAIAAWREYLNSDGPPPKP